MFARKIWRSRTGWIFCAFYLIAAVILFGEAVTCTGWDCDLVAIPVHLPMGYFCYMLYQFSGLEFIFGPETFLSPTKFIVPTILMNALFYYFIGYAASVGVIKLKNELSRGNSTDRTS